MLEFGYITESLEAAEVLIKLYNLILTFFYFYILNEGRKVIKSILRKGRI
jgi:hypothetical protein